MDTSEHEAQDELEALEGIGRASSRGQVGGCERPADTHLLQKRARLEQIDRESQSR